MNQEEETIAHNLYIQWIYNYWGKFNQFRQTIPMMSQMQIEGYTDLLNKTFPGTEPKKNNE